MFKDRTDAAHQLLGLVNTSKKSENWLVLAIPRGGLAVGAVIARSLNVPLDIVLAKKIGAPHNPELAIGAATQRFFFVQPPYQTKDFEQQAHLLQAKLHNQARTYRQKLPPRALANKTVVLVDDGIATGQTMYAAIQEVKQQKPQRIIVAVPVISAQTKDWLKPEVDTIISVIEPRDLSAIGAYYQNFEQIDDETAIALLTDTQKIVERDH